MLATTPVPAPGLAPTGRTSLGASAPGLTRPGRLDTVDAVRGLAIVLMALDHTRASLSAAHVDPTDLAHATPLLFLTHWITHLCAPAFVLLAGVCAWLGGQRRTTAQLSWFLLQRGLWLMALEFTVISFGWYFNATWETGAIAHVIWAIGFGFLALAGLVHLPIYAVGVLGAALVLGHNLLDAVPPTGFGPLAPLWALLHLPGQVPGLPVLVVYPVLPWAGVMALGFALGPLLYQDDTTTQRRLRQLGVGAIALFLLLRAANGYGDPSPWTPQPTPTLATLSFLNTTRYPPSLLYLLMTLGPTLLLLAVRYPTGSRVAGWLRTLGAAPLFFYVTHIYFVHLLALALGLAQGFPAEALAQFYPFFPTSYGVGLAGVYAAWGALLLTLYPLTREFGHRKRAARAWWWSYL